MGQRKAVWWRTSNRKKGDEKAMLTWTENWNGGKWEKQDEDAAENRIKACSRTKRSNRRQEKRNMMLELGEQCDRQGKNEGKWEKQNEDAAEDRIRTCNRRKPSNRRQEKGSVMLELGDVWNGVTGKGNEEARRENNMAGKRVS